MQKGTTVLKALRAIEEALAQRGIESPRLEAEVFLSRVLGLSRAEIYSRGERELKEGELLALRDMVQRRLQGEPVAYIIGEKEFWSLTLKVSPSCLIPRPSTEVLVEEAIGVARALPRPMKVLDIGTGCGAIAIALAKELEGAEVWATDISPYALEVARENVLRHGVGPKVRLLRADLFPDEGGFSLIVSNPPYIPTHELFRLPEEVRDYEPLEALNGGPDGLEVIRRIVSRAGEHLLEGGWLLLEVGEGQAQRVLELMEGAGFEDLGLRRDYAGVERVVKGRKGWGRPT